ncbi:MAG: trypsin-like peptidase domain-containing protein [Phycisphaerae bacterium]|nr:trypsin-like peptidase domain-containing protein [Phycisphaerae bacterium]
MKSKRIAVIVIGVALLVGIVTVCMSEVGGSQIQVSAPLATDSAGRMRAIATESVFRLIISKENRMGTGFLHVSGNVLTAAHVIEGADPNDVVILMADGKRISVEKIVADFDVDIAMLIPKRNIKAKALPLATAERCSVGAQVSTWGFPAGYHGVHPMLSVGYLSGKDVIRSPSGKTVGRFVVNAAFNAGNSGGPLIDIESGAVIGLVASKLAPLPSYIKSALKALKDDTSISAFWVTKSDGTKERISNSQVLEQVLQYLRSQVQLVIGQAVLTGDINTFLKKHKAIK